MNITAIVVGLEKWQEYTKPALESIRKTNPDMDVICVDNGSEEPYGVVPGTTMVKSAEKRSYAGGINVGLKYAPRSSWYIILNNDVLFYKDIMDRFVELDPQVLYGFKLWPMGTAGMPTQYLCGWCLFLSDYMYDRIGDFDERCAPMFFEDADYSIRVLKEDMELVELDRKDWGLRHLEDERMGERVDYYRRFSAARQSVRNYIKRKHGY